MTLVAALLLLPLPLLPVEGGTERPETPLCVSWRASIAAAAELALE